MRTHLLPLLAVTFITALAPSTASAAEDKEEGFVKLYNGKNFDGLKFVPAGIDATKTWSIEGGVIVCTGKPNAYFATEKSYKNYVLRLDVKYPKTPGNSGVLVHIQGDHKVWPKCVEVQGQYAGLCSIFPIGGVKGQRADDGAARKKAIKAHNEWNSIEIVTQDGKITSYINGEKIAEAGPFDVMEGPIGFQSEGTEIHFRNLRIKETK